MQRHADIGLRQVAIWLIVLTGLTTGTSFGVTLPHSTPAAPPRSWVDAGTVPGSLRLSLADAEPSVRDGGQVSVLPPGEIGDPPYWLGGHIAPIVPDPGTRPAASPPANVNPMAGYSAEPAPEGVGDFGINFTGSAYTYYTSAFRANAHINSYSTLANFGTTTSNDTTFQLNVVVVLSRGTSLAEYWIQDVPILNSSSHYIQFENNIWNFSGPGAALPANSVSGNGTVYTLFTGSGTEQYYADGVASGYPGAGATLSFPANISTQVTASNISGTIHVGFEYDDGYGWATYDNVTFPWTHGWTLRGFEVNGSAYNPFGLFDDAEWIVGGPGGGSTMLVQHANLTMTLETFNGHNFEAVPNAFDFGSDTAETASDVAPSLPNGAAPGIPSDRMLAGSGSLHFLYGAGNTSTINVTAPILNGTLLAGTPDTGYRGQMANLTLLPGSYQLGVENATTVVATKNVTLTAREYLPVSFAKFTISPARSHSEQRVTAAGSGFIASSKVSVDWPANATAQCQATAGTNGTFSCGFVIPLVPVANYNLTASDNASSDDTAYTTLVVTTNLSVAAASSSAATDLGGSLRFWANASGGFPPYTSYLWNFGNGVDAHTTTGTINYTYLKAGSYSVSVTVRDRAGDSLSANAAVRIRPDPSVTAPEANRTAADLGQSVAFSVVASSGLAPYTFAWIGLPPGCIALGASGTCSNLTAPGIYSIAVNLTDSEGYKTVGVALLFQVFADPVISLFTNLQPFLDAGENLSLVANASLGSGGYSYTWTGLPAGCAPNATVARCRVLLASNYLVAVLVKDSDGGVARSSVLSITVSPYPIARFAATGGASYDLGQSSGFAVVTSGGSGLLSFLWSGLPTGCGSANVSSFACSPTVAGTYHVTVAVSDQSGAIAVANRTYSVFSSPSIRWVPASSTSEDVGLPITLEAVASGGVGPYQYAWTNLPVGCPSVNSAILQCEPSAPGSFSVSANATDANNATASTPATVETIAARPAVVSFSASPTQLVAGGSLTLSAILSGGTGAYTYQWRQLPAGCEPLNLSTLTCRPTSSGVYSISVTATDGVGVSANATVRVTVTATVLGLAPDEGYAVILLGVVGLGVVLALAVRWVRRTGGQKEANPPGPDP